MTKMAKGALFELPAAQEPAPAPPTRPGAARVRRPIRTQLQWLPHDLEAAVAQDHPARAIWDLLERLDPARAPIERRAHEREHPDPGVTKREQAARERAARERMARVEQAVAALPQVQAAKARQQHTLATPKRVEVRAPRTSTTDPQA